MGNTRFEELCFKAYFVDNEIMADHDVLRRLASEAGLSADAVDHVLESREYEDDVRADENEVSALGVHAVPFFVINDTYALSGCYPTDEFVRVLSEVRDKEHAAAAQGAARGTDGRSF